MPSPYRRVETAVLDVRRQPIGEISNWTARWGAKMGTIPVGPWVVGRVSPCAPSSPEDLLGELSGEADPGAPNWTRKHNPKNRSLSPSSGSCISPELSGSQQKGQSGETAPLGSPYWTVKIFPSMLIPVKQHGPITALRFLLHNSTPLWDL